MLTVIFHFSAFFIAVTGFIGVYASYLRSGSINKRLKDFSLFFLSFAVYSLLLSAYFITDDLVIINYAYNAGLVFLFGVLFFALKVCLHILNFSAIKRMFILSLLSTVGLIVVIMHFYDFRLPVIHESGLILWNGNPLAAWAMSVASVSVAFIWIYVFLRNMYRASGIAILKNSLLVLMAVGFGIAGLFYFHPSYEFTVAAFVGYEAGFFFAFLLIIVSFIEVIKKEKSSGTEEFMQKYTTS